MLHRLVSVFLHMEERDEAIHQLAWSLPAPTWVAAVIEEK